MRQWIVPHISLLGREGSIIPVLTLVCGLGLVWAVVNVMADIKQQLRRLTAKK